MKRVITPALVWMFAGVAIGVAFAFVVFAPATWLASGLARASEGRIVLEAPRGTIWNGSGALVLAGGEGSLGAFSLPTRLAWQFRPRWMGLDIALDLSCCTLAASPVKIGLRAVELDSVSAINWQIDARKVNLPAQLLTGLGAPWNTMQLSGNLSLSSEQLAGKWSAAQGASNISGRAVLEITELTTALSTVRPLGSYRLSSAGLAITLETLGEAPVEAALLLSGTGQFEQGRVSFLGEATASKGYEEALSNLLHIIGQWQPSPDGRSRSILKL